MFGFEHIIGLLEGYKYIFAFLLLVVEGPVTSIAIGLLASLGVFSLLGAFLVILFGDLAGDMLYYGLGRFGRENKFVLKLSRYLGVTDERIAQLEHHFEENGGKTVVVGKFAYGFGTIFCVSAGVAEFPFHRFLFFSALASFFKSLLLLGTGYFFGRTYLAFVGEFEWVLFVLGACLVALWILFLFYQRRIRKLFKKIF